MNESLLDTDTLSEIIRMKNKSIVARAREYLAQYGAYSFSTITVFEITQGYCKVGAEKRLHQFLRQVENERVLPFTTSMAVLAGRIDAELERRGVAVGRSDCMIAATAIEHGLELVTGNTRHFERIREIGFPLLLANWRDGDG
jgi:tRNA(fMet)-specific endonuclease VapC